VLFDVLRVGARVFRDVTPCYWVNVTKAKHKTLIKRQGIRSQKNLNSINVDTSKLKYLSKFGYKPWNQWSTYL